MNMLICISPIDGAEFAQRNALEFSEAQAASARATRKAPVPERRKDPALGDLHGDLDFGLVARLVGPSPTAS